MLKKIITNILLSLNLIKAKEEVKIEPVIEEKAEETKPVTKTKVKKVEKAKPTTKKYKNETKQTRGKK